MHKISLILDINSQIYWNIRKVLKHTWSIWMSRQNTQCDCCYCVNFEQDWKLINWLFWCLIVNNKPSIQICVHYNQLNLFLFFGPLHIWRSIATEIIICLTMEINTTDRFLFEYCVIWGGDHQCEHMLTHIMVLVELTRCRASQQWPTE